MNKRKIYDYAFKLQCVEAVLKDHNSIRSVVQKYGLRKSNLQLWLAFYNAYGPKGLKKQRNQHYDVAFKLKVLTTIDKEHLSLTAACARFNIPNESIIFSWRREYELKGLSGITSKARGRPKKMDTPAIKRKPRKSNKPLTREEELLLEIQALKAENELLKKLQALTQAKRKQKP
jgi:transposase